LAAAIKKTFGINAEYIKSGGGAFEVFLDGTKIYSKMATGRFPENGEIISKISSITS